MKFKDYIKEAKLRPEVQKARKLKGKDLQKIMEKLYQDAFSTLYALDVVLSDSFGKADPKGIKMARVMVQKSLSELGALEWIKSMDIAFTGKSDIKSV